MPEFRIHRRPLRIALVLALAATAVPGSALAQQVLHRARLGHNIEDIDFARSGALANQVVILDGYDVYGFPVGQPGAPIRKLFDVRGAALHSGPRGIAHLRAEDAFAVMEPSQPDQLFVVDPSGRSLGARTVRYPGDDLPGHLEGLVALPPTSPRFPDHLVLVTERFFPEFESRLEVFRPDGQIVHEIRPAAPIGQSFVSGVAFLEPDRLVVSLGDDTLWTLDLDGNVVAGPVVVEGVVDIEGIVQVAGGRVVAADLQAGGLTFFDAGLERLAAEDRSYALGIGLNGTYGLAWNSDTDAYLIDHLDLPFTHTVASVSPALDAASPVAQLPPDFSLNFHRSLTYLPDEHRVAVVLPTSVVQLYDAGGALVEEMDLSSLGPINAIEYLAPLRQFAVTTDADGDERNVHLVTRHGVPVRTLDLSAIGVHRIEALAFFGPGDRTGAFLVIDHPFAGDSAYVIDLQGRLLSSFNYREKLGVIRPFDVTAITSGPSAGAFALIDDYASELVAFTLR